MTGGGQNGVGESRPGWVHGASPIGLTQNPAKLGGPERVLQSWDSGPSPTSTGDPDTQRPDISGLGSLITDHLVATASGVLAINVLRSLTQPQRLATVLAVSGSESDAVLAEGDRSQMAVLSTSRADGPVFPWTGRAVSCS